MFVIDPTRNFLPLPTIAVRLQVPLRRLEAAARRLGIEPHHADDGLPVFTEADLERIREHLAAAPAESPAPDPLLDLKLAGLFPGNDL